jgi:hypothetical protein
VEQATLTNYKKIENLVDTYFPLDDKSKERFRDNLYNPEIDSIYSEMINPETLRVEKELGEDDMEIFDEGWKYFKELFQVFVKNMNMEYPDFVRGSMYKGKNLVKVSKLLAEFYTENQNSFCQTVYPRWDYAMYEDKVKRNPGRYIKNITDEYYKKYSGMKFSGKSKGFKIVLSLNFTDWFLCSTRESWTSCLNLESEYGGAYWSGLPGTVVDKNRALLYLTDGNKKDYWGIETNKILSRSWVIFDDDDLLHLVRFFPSNIDTSLIRKKFPEQAWKYLPEERTRFISKHNLNFLKHLSGDTCFIYQDNTILDKIRSKYYIVGSPGSGGFYHIDRKNNITAQEVFSFGRGLNFLMENRNKTLKDYFYFSGPRCRTCNCNLLDENAIHWHYDYSYCFDCRDRYFKECPVCHEMEDTEEMCRVHMADGTKQNICRTCFDNNGFSNCSKCWDYFERESLTVVDGQHYICPDCLRQHYTKCNNCGKIIVKRDITDDVCRDCRYEQVRNEGVAAESQEQQPEIREAVVGGTPINQIWNESPYTTGDFSRSLNEIRAIIPPPLHSTPQYSWNYDDSVPSNITFTIRDSSQDETPEDE